MALAIAKVNTDTRQHVLGNRREICTDITLDNSYPSGGYPLTGKLVGLEQLLDEVIVVPTTTGHVFAYDAANGKLRVFSAGTEAAPNDDLHTVVARLIVRGKGTGYPIT